MREDDEQKNKLQETIELLVAAGYFRARIKGLTAFDKIVGGMTWCIDICNFDIDVDLLFNESSTIGQKLFELYNFYWNIVNFIDLLQLKIKKFSN